MVHGASETSSSVRSTRGGTMASTQDPTDHFRTTHPHAGESFIDAYCWPGLLSIALGVISLIGCVVAAVAIAGGIAWLVVEHHRVLRIERRWLAEHPESPSIRA